MSKCKFEMDLGDAGVFDFIVEYDYYPACAATWPGGKEEVESVTIQRIAYGGVNWTRQLGRIIKTDAAFLAACRQEWLNEIAERQLNMAGA